MTTLEVLRGARAKLSQGWCQGAAARDANGAKVYVLDSDAVCWCGIGAVYSAADGDEASGDRALAAVVRMLDGERLLSLWNDSSSRTQAEVLELFDRAIAREERAA